MSMEKISKEELKNLLGGKALSDDDLEMVTGGESHSCFEQGQADLDSCLSQPDIDLTMCYMWYHQFMAECVD